MTDVFIRKRRGRFLRQKEDTGRCRQRSKLWCRKSRTARGQQRLEEARKNLLLDLWRVCSPVYSLIWTFSLQNDERINYCCLSHWVYGYFFTAVPGKQYIYDTTGSLNYLGINPSINVYNLNGKKIIYF